MEKMSQDTQYTDCSYKKLISTLFSINFVEFLAVTIWDASCMTLVFVLNDDKEISLTFETDNNRFQFQGSHSEEFDKIDKKVSFFYAFQCCLRQK